MINYAVSLFRGTVTKALHRGGGSEESTRRIRRGRRQRSARLLVLLKELWGETSEFEDSSSPLPRASIVAVTLLTSLERLTLTSFELSRADVERIATALPHLKALHLSCCSSPHGDWMTYVAQWMNQLQVLTIENVEVPIPESELIALSACYYLRKLQLCAPKISAGVFESLRTLEMLEVLIVYSAVAVDDLAIAAVVRSFPRLEHFCGGYVVVTDAGLAHLASLRCLTHLDLGNAFHVSDAGLAHLTPLCELRYLNLHRCSQLTDQALACFSPSLLNLNHLHLSECTGVTDAGLACLTTMKQLQYLDLANCRLVTDEGIRAVSMLVTLQTLVIRGCRNVTDAGMLHLASLRCLKHLDLGECECITDIGANCISTLAQLTFLSLVRCSLITDDALAQLGAQLHQLEALYLAECTSITDIGLSHLFGLKYLRVLLLRKCMRTSPAGRKRLERQLPKLAVWFNGPPAIRQPSRHMCIVS